MSFFKTIAKPTFSPEHGVYVVLIISFLMGAELASRWHWETTIAFLTAFSAFQAEHPLTLQIKQRLSLKPRFLFWGVVYGLVALAGGMYLAFLFPPLLAIYGVAILTFMVDAIAVYHKKQKAIWNEFLTFASVCLVTPFAYGATNGDFIPEVWGLWVLNTLFFASAIFTVKLRKPKTSSFLPAFVYHGVAISIIAIVWYFGLLPSFSVLAFTIVLLKLLIIVIFADWYKTTKIQNVAILETLSAIAFLVCLTFAVLPSHLNSIGI
jgi:YwiC-like protein